VINKELLTYLLTYSLTSAQYETTRRNLRAAVARIFISTEAKGQRQRQVGDMVERGAHGERGSKSL